MFKSNQSRQAFFAGKKAATPGQMPMSQPQGIKLPPVPKQPSLPGEEDQLNTKKFGFPKLMGIMNANQKVKMPKV